jgi:hypothetical protein
VTDRKSFEEAEALHVFLKKVKDVKEGEKLPVVSSICVLNIFAGQQKNNKQTHHCRA